MKTLLVTPVIDMGHKTHNICTAKRQGNEGSDSLLL